MTAQLIGVHITAPMILTRAALPYMITRGHRAVINVASLLVFSASLPPGILPHGAVYAAAKAYLIAFTQAWPANSPAPAYRPRPAAPAWLPSNSARSPEWTPASSPSPPCHPRRSPPRPHRAPSLRNHLRAQPGRPAILQRHTDIQRQIMLAAAGRPLAARYTPGAP